MSPKSQQKFVCLSRIRKVDMPQRKCYPVVTKWITLKGGPNMNDKLLVKTIEGKFKSQAAFAVQVGWTPQKLHKMLVGQYIPKISEAVFLSKALGITLNDFANFFS